jgi:short-subunit dehydrogenase
MTKPLENKTVVITGASSGIGRAAAEAFARAGARLVLASRNEQTLAPVVEACRDLGADAMAVPTDVTDLAQVEALARRACAFGGTIDVWYSNVGVGVVAKYWDAPMEVHEQVVRSNLLGHMNDAYAAVPIFLEQGHGTFINMISVGGFAASPYAAAYSASKFGLRGFTEALRGELARFRDIHICDVYPSFVDSPGIPHAANHTGKALKIPPLALDPHRVADAVVRLALEPQDQLIVGKMTHVIRAAHSLAPSLGARIFCAALDYYFANAKRAPITDGNLFEAPRYPSPIDSKPRKGIVKPMLLAVGAATAVSLMGMMAGRRNGSRTGARRIRAHTLAPSV